MKFMVMVNNKFMVSVEATSNAAAEHKILDDIYDGMQSALAFDKESMKTDHFRGCLMACETISFNELKKMSEAYSKQWNKFTEAKSVLDSAVENIRSLEKQLEAAKEIALHAKQRCDEEQHLANLSIEMLANR